jgi:hypothetical protein
MGGAQVQYIAAAFLVLIMLSLDFVVWLVVGVIALVIWLITHV